MSLMFLRLQKKLLKENGLVEKQNMQMESCCLPGEVISFKHRDDPEDCFLMAGE